MSPDAAASAATAHLPAPGRRLPVSTYRLQLSPDLTFADAERLVPYLTRLGVTDLYLSPVLQAAPGSTHGYDVVDHSRISADLGGREALERLCTTAHAAGLGVVVDVVPNHMAVPTPVWHNKALWSVLKEGPASPYAAWFDLDLELDRPGILMPVLGQRIGQALASGELRVEQMVVPSEPEAGEQPVLRYYEHVFPVRPSTEHLPLADLLDRQFYRLSYWRVADEELNYRRFFDVDTLAAVRMEDPDVFQATHGVLLELIAAGHVDALRIDHPDGLADPRDYFQRLDEATGGAWVVAEKILEGDETLPADWPVAGTTGYDAAWRINSVLTDPSGSGALGTAMTEIAGDSRGELSALVAESKRQVIATSLYAEVHRLATILRELCDHDVRLRDHTLRSLEDCVVELLVAFDRYRAYVVPGEPAPPLAERVVREAAEHARARLDEDRHETLDLVVELVLGNEVGSAGKVHDARRAELIVRFQQTCGAVMAKGVEDTAYYRWTHLVSLCEVGGSPRRFGISVDELHAWATQALYTHPATMTAGSTHDTKRGEDVRARIGVLSEYADEWLELVRGLRVATADLRPTDLDGRAENLLWQTVAGTWTEDGPISAQRLRDYLTKAVREQKSWTTWTDPDAEREESLLAYASAILEHPEVHAALTAWGRTTAASVRAAVLGYKLLQLTIAGVADVYQGTEVTQTSLVDPDNRRPVDFAGLDARLERLDAGATPGSLDEVKLALTAQALRLRRREADAFVGAEAQYLPLPTSTGHAIAFARADVAGPRAVTVVTRLARGLDALGGFGEHSVVLPEGRWRDVLTRREYPGGPCRLADLLDPHPVALLERADD
ncbi:malto-oligosyltrehalose synthase [Georgenia sp. 311]|uniref:Malto-oligosyltrehalose synthase n=1 Tax=Georgenia wutianyii TaxID=2585135 RepID=A0ABX5VLP8_9MICO|nr:MULTISPECIES: malto-oligosyltrehalose synthase [Georgenia]QDB79411.1 malto-oligosyltrehalose synthase [Georgenia wutianyii]TNC19536.1 malto-oligosyltrehalose synthase [Georgenia sp. 311]